MTAPAPSTSRWSGSFLLSALLHGVIVVLLVVLNYVSRPSDDDQPKVFELVAGEGDNFSATEAPALGTPGGVKLDLPAPVTPKFEAPKFQPPPEPPAPPPPVPQANPAPPESTPPVPVEPAPAPVPAPKPAPVKAEKQPVPDMAKKLRRDVIKAESKAKQQVAKERAAEEKRVADEKKRMTKAEFDARNQGKADPAAKASKVARVDAEGIAKGVRGGSTANTTGGAGGKALSSSSDDVLGAYFEMFKLRLREQFELPPGVSDSLKAGVEFQIAANGAIGGARITKSSGSGEFDRAVLDAIRRVRMPARPDKRSETVAFVFTLRDRNNEG